MTIKADRTYNFSGVSCPMLIVLASQKIEELEVGQIMKVITTDCTSMRDYQVLAEINKTIELISQETVLENNKEIYVHLFRKLETL